MRSRHGGSRIQAYATKSGIAPSARWTCPDSGIAVERGAARTKRRRSSASSIAGSRNEICPSRWPVLCCRRYGARAKSTPPSSAGPRGKSERAQPPAREAACGEEGQQQHEVVGPGGPEGALERPERRSQQPALEVRALRRLGLERVRVAPRRPPVLELVPGQPVVPDELEIVAGRLLAVARCGAGQVVAVHVAHGGPRSDHEAGEEDG